MKILLAWLAVVGIPFYAAWQHYPPRPGDNNDVPMLLGFALIAWVTVGTCCAVNRWWASA